ncbi:MAG: hypothetical protein E6581_04940, partial [Cutibacterium granulosum]|nr:hypothetical protein [Cutibacterium granulosum]
MTSAESTCWIMSPPSIGVVYFTDRGIEELREHLLQLTSREHARDHSFRLAIDRAFTVKGAGLV